MVTTKAVKRRKAAAKAKGIPYEGKRPTRSSAVVALFDLPKRTNPAKLIGFFDRRTRVITTPTGGISAPLDTKTLDIPGLIMRGGVVKFNKSHLKRAQAIDRRTEQVESEDF